MGVISSVGLFTQSTFDLGHREFDCPFPRIATRSRKLLHSCSFKCSICIISLSQIMYNGQNAASRIIGLESEFFVCG